MSLIGLSMLYVGAPASKAPHLRVTTNREADCPRCGARVGLSCIAPNGRPTRAHSERIKLCGGDR